MKVTLPYLAPLNEDDYPIYHPIIKMTPPNMHIQS